MPPPRSRERLALSRTESDYSIVAVSVKSGSTEEDAADDEEEKRDKGKVEIEVQGKRLQAVDKGEEHIECSESEYSGSDSPCVSVPRVKASTDKRSVHGSVSVSVSAPDSVSKVTSSTVAVAPTPSASKLQLGDKTTRGSTGSLHIREAAESMFLQMHRVANVDVEQVEVTTLKKDTTVLEGLVATPIPGNLGSAGNWGRVEPPAPVPVPVPASVSSRRKEEPAIALAPYQPPPKSQLLDEPRVELRPISLGLIKDGDIMFHFSEAEHIRLASNLTTEAPQRVNHNRRDARPLSRVASPKRSMSVKKSPVVTKDVRPGGHTMRRDAIPSSGSEYEGGIHEDRSRPNEEKRTPARLPDFGNPFATPSSSSRPTTANTTTTSSASATGHASSFEWAAPSRKRSTRADRGGFKRTTIVARFVDGSNLGHGVEGDVEDAGDDDDEDDDEFEVETEHGRVLKKLVKEKGSWPSAMSFHDVLSEPTTAARAHGYATKLNELYNEDCGLGDWIEVWLKPSEWRLVVDYEGLLILFICRALCRSTGYSPHWRVRSYQDRVWCFSLLRYYLPYAI